MIMKKILPLLMLLILVGCATDEKLSYAPVKDINRAPAKYTGKHIVDRGETLYSIAWRYNRDFVELARINGIRSPYRIREGETLYLAADQSKKTAHKTKQRVVAKQAAKPAAAETTLTMDTKQAWHWPTSGKIIQHFSSQNEQKGIDLAGRKGQAILAAAPGEVVYSGDGLRGYGKLIIIKHNDEFLSAYAHNNKLLVAEGTMVQASQKIAEMGQTDAATAMLHFEIRRHGNPVDPLQFLPKRG
jgi:lipoprotein NlpD